ncbi:hypothetical protein [Priestia flexa]|nr:hypothetical protein [Priestia flexa]
MSILFATHFATMDYNKLHWLDITASILAVVWLVLTIIIIVLKRRNA